MSWQPNIKSHQPTGLPLTALIRELRVPLVVALLALQTALAVLLAARALTESATQSPAAAPGIAGLLVWAAIAAGLAAAARWAWFAEAVDSSRAFDAAARYLPLVAVSITAAAIPLAGAGLTRTALAWLLLAAEELLALAALSDGRLAERLNFFRRAAPDLLRRGGRTPSSVIRPAATPAEEDVVARPSMAPETLPANAACVQQLLRVQNVDGADRLEGRLSTRFALGQTTAQIHLSFCPSFARVPTFDFRQLAGPQARVKLGQLLPHGARLEVKLSEPAAVAGQVTLEIVARHAPEPATVKSSAPGASAER